MTDMKVGALGAGARRRRRWPWILLGLFVALALAVLAAPSLASGWVTGAVEESFARDHRGRIEVEDVSLAWFSRQSIGSARLVDPDGREVARASVELPSLAQLVRGGGRRIGAVSIRASADLAADDAGLSNLERALEASEAATARASEPRGEAEPTDVGALVRELDLELSIEIDRLAWSDATSRALGKPFELANARIDARAKPGEPLRFGLTGSLASEGGAPLEASATVSDAFDAQGISPRLSFEASAKASRLPAGLVDALAATDGLVAAVLGERFDVEASASGTLASGRIDARIAGDEGEVDLACELRDRVLQGAEPHALEVHSGLSAARIEPFLRGIAPAGVEIARIDGSRMQPHPFEVVIEHLRIDLGPLLEARGAGAAGFVASLVDATEVRVRTELGAWSVRGELLGLAQPLELLDPRFSLSILPFEGTRVVHAELESDLVTAKLDGTIEGATWRGEPGEALVLGVTVPPEVARALNERFLPPGTSLELGSEVEIRLDELVLPLDRLFAGEPLAVVAEHSRARSRVSVASATYRDESDAQHPLRFEASNLSVAVECTPVEGRLPLAASVAAMLAVHDESTNEPRRGGRLDLAVKLDDARALLDGGDALPPITTVFEVSAGDSLAPFVSDSLRATIDDLAGPTLTGKIALTPGAGAWRDDLAVVGELRGEHVQLDLFARLDHGVARIQGQGARFDLRVQPTPALIARTVGPSLPEKASLELAAPGAPITLSVRDLALMFDAPAADLLRRLSAAVHVELPALTYSQPPVSGGGQPVPIEVGSLAIDARARPGEPATLDVAGAIGGGANGSIELRARCPDAGAFADDRPEAQPPSIAFDGELRGLPTALADALAGQRGLLVDVLGATMDATVAGAWPKDPLRATLRSPTTSLEVDARFEDGRLVAQDAQGLRARLPLTPLFNERIVGKLLPLAIDLAKPEGADPIALDVSAFTLPLDGDLARLNGKVRLDLGEVVYGVLPGLTDALAFAGVAAPSGKKTRLPALEVEIVNGVARYERLPISIAGHELVFRGRYDLTKSEFDLSTDIPLALLGKDAAKAIDKVRDYVDPQTLVPISLRGTWKKPKLRIDEKFAGDLLEKAAKGALERGLFDLIDKKKKDKDKDKEKKKEGGGG